MEVFKYITESDVMEVIEEVALKCSTRPHSIYGIDDLKQHVRILCWQKLPEFDLSKKKTNKAKQALMNWLSNIAHKRLINLHRDMMGAAHKTFKKDTDFSKIQRKNLMEPVSLEESDEVNSITYDVSYIDISLLNIISSELSDEYIEILDRLLSGLKIPSYYRRKLECAVNEVINGKFNDK